MHGGHLEIARLQEQAGAPTSELTELERSFRFVWRRRGGSARHARVRDPSTGSRAGFGLGFDPNFLDEAVALHGAGEEIARIVADDDKSRISGQFQRVEANLESRMERLERETGPARGMARRKSGHVETALLTEFHRWASPVDIRARSHAAALRALDIELETVAD